jgi:ABC-type amino acid transport substrate-binding protein
LPASLAIRPAAAQTVRKAVVGVVTTAPPFSYIDNGRYTGISNDILQRVAELKRLELNYTPLKFDALIPSVQAGQIDIAVSGIFVTEARKRIVDFSDPYFVQGAVLVAPVGSALSGVQDLKGKRIASGQGSAALALARENADAWGVEIRVFQDVNTMHLAMRSGDVDAMIYDSGIIAHQLRTEGSRPTIKTISDVLRPTGIAFAFAKGSDLVTLVNDGMAEMRARGEIASIVTKYNMG